MKFDSQDILALTLAVAIHLLVALLLWFGAPELFQAEKPRIIPVKAVFLDTQRAAAEAREQELARQRAAEEARRRKAEEEARRKAEEEARKKAAEEARRKAEEEARRKAEEEARRKAEAEARKQAEAEARRKAEEEARRKAEEAARKKAEEAARRKAEEEARKRQQQEREKRLREALAAEEAELEAQRRAAAQAKQDESDKAAYARMLSEHIERQWVRPAGVEQDFSCRIRIRQLPGGQIQSYELLESCGNSFLDASVENAIRKSDPLPLPNNDRVFDRTLELIFQP